LLCRVQTRKPPNLLLLRQILHPKTGFYRQIPPKAGFRRQGQGNPALFRYSFGKTQALLFFLAPGCAKNLKACRKISLAAANMAILQFAKYICTRLRKIISS